ncbi:MAG: TRAP transporter substrate-binding protein [Pseudomonadota bacterium]
MKPVLHLSFFLLSLNALATARASELWQMSAEQPASNFITRVARDFARNVRTATQGQLLIHVVPDSSLYSRQQVKAAVQRGDIQVGDMFMSALGKEDVLFELDSLPFLATDYEQAKILWRVSRPLIEQRLLKDGVRLLYAVPWPPQSLYTNQPITRMADFQGMKLRSYNPMISRMIELMGGEPTLITTAQVPAAFKAGQVEGLLTSSTTGVDLRVWSFAEHLLDIRAFIPKNIVMVNEAAFQRLAPEVQDALLGAARSAEIQGWELSWALTGYQLRTLKRLGVTVVDPLPEGLDSGFDRIGETLANEWLEKAGPAAREVLDAYHGASPGR